jgi:glyoxylase-like metal-dependent hydrolase (beta-lactamase superfamily II)
MPEISVSKLTAPLPGGSAGSHVTMRPLSTGEMAPPRGFGADDPTWSQANRWSPCPIFLLEHPTAGYVLIDTGLPTAAAHDPKIAFGRAAAAVVRVRVDPSQPLPARLRELDIKPSDIKTVVLTHLHLDHAGSIADLPGATFVLTQPEWDSANEPRAILRGYYRRQFNYGFDYRLVNYNADETRSFASFGRSFDLFGDGTVQLVSTPGHTAGHQSVVVRLRNREALLCGDAAYTRETIEKTMLPKKMQDEHNFKRSLREIRAYAQMTPSALVIPGHDKETFERLEAVYD